MEPSVVLLFAIGFLGSVHCLGMCGSIAGALALSLAPSCRQDPGCLVRYLLAYNLGRILSYGIAGGLGGLIGSTLSGAELIPRAHDLFRTLAAVVVIAAGFYLTGWIPQLRRMDALGRPLWRRLEPLGRTLLPVRSLTHAFLYGIVWGWLPCGLVYYALALTLSAATVVQGALFMILFGLGTLPAVAGIGSITGLLAGLARSRVWQQVCGLLLIAVALLGLLFGRDFP